MLPILPFLTWLAAITSAVLLVFLWDLGVLRRFSLVITIGVFLVAGYCQFFSGSPMVAALGVALQTMLAVYLMARWKFSG